MWAKSPEFQCLFPLFCNFIPILPSSNHFYKIPHTIKASKNLSVFVDILHMQELPPKIGKSVVL
jgi:hypothetical protein